MKSELEFISKATISGTGISTFGFPPYSGSFAPKSPILRDI